MPKNQRRANQGGGAERHGRSQRRPAERGQAGYNTSITHRETRAQDGKDHHGGGKRRSGAQAGERRAGRDGTGNLGAEAQHRGMKVSNERGRAGQFDDDRSPRVGRDGRLVKGATKVAAPRKQASKPRRGKMKGTGPASKRKGTRPRAPVRR
jgi:hypothetical protein